MMCKVDKYARIPYAIAALSSPQQRQVYHINGSFSGIFWGIYMLSNILGNLGSFLVFDVSFIMTQVGGTLD